MRRTTEAQGGGVAVRMRDIVLVALAGTVGAAAASAIGTGAAAIRIARSVIVPPRRRPDDVRVVSVDAEAGTVTLSATPDAVLPGGYTFWFDRERGLARLGPPLLQGNGWVTRAVEKQEQGRLRPGDRGRISGWYFTHPRDLDLPTEDVEVPTVVGPAPAWLIPPAGEQSPRWAVHIHGRATTRPEAIRGLPVFREAGYTSLVVSYRNDGEAPPGPDGRYGLGLTEWADVESALETAVSRGADEIVLVGWSMGGAIALQTVLRSAHRNRIRGVVLDSPVIDWVRTLEYQGSRLRIPRFLVTLTLELLRAGWSMHLLGQRAPIDFPALDMVERAGELSVPVLILHSDDDGFVPSIASRLLAAARPDLVTLDSFAVARHTKLWNVDRTRWEETVRSWLSALDASARRGRSRRRAGAR